MSQKEAENNRCKERKKAGWRMEKIKADLMDVLAEGRHCRQLADEIQVGSSKGIQSTAVEQWQIILIDLGQLL